MFCDTGVMSTVALPGMRSLVMKMIIQMSEVAMFAFIVILEICIIMFIVGVYFITIKMVHYKRSFHIRNQTARGLSISMDKME